LSQLDSANRIAVRADISAASDPHDLPSHTVERERVSLRECGGEKREDRRVTVNA
jgi:hypothetical protein